MNEKAEKQSFPSSFWTANLTELLERGAYYAVASFVVIYLGRLGLGDYWPSTLNGLLWTLIYFLPILSGTIADQIGFKKALIIAFILVGIGYFMMGYPVWFGGATLMETAGNEVSANSGVFFIIFAAVFLIGIGGSFVKPCISGTVQKTAGLRVTLGFGIFYMVINIGSLFGRGISYFVRINLGLSFIFAVAVACSLLALLVVLFIYKDPDRQMGNIQESKPKKTVRQILIDMVLVLKSLRFLVFLIITSGFFFIYSQVYNIFPLYLDKVIQKGAPIDLITMANPFVIVFFQLLITKKFGKMKPINSIIVGIIIISVALTINFFPIFLGGGLKAIPIKNFLPLGAIFITLTVALIAFGELFTSARIYEYIGALAPKGQEGLFLGYSNLPVAIGALVGGPAGAVIFNEIMCRGAVTLPNGLLELKPFWNSMGWIILTGIGLLSALSMWLYNRWLIKQKI